MLSSCSSLIDAKLVTRKRSSTAISSKREYDEI